MTNNSEIFDRVKKIIINHLGAEEAKVIEAANFIDDLGADSLDQVELVMAFEEEFGIEIPDEAAEKITTVGSAVKYISENIFFIPILYARTNKYSQYGVSIRYHKDIGPTSWNKIGCPIILNKATENKSKFRGL